MTTHNRKRALPASANPLRCVKRRRKVAPIIQLPSGLVVRSLMMAGCDQTWFRVMCSCKRHRKNTLLQPAKEHTVFHWSNRLIESIYHGHVDPAEFRRMVMPPRMSSSENLFIELFTRLTHLNIALPRNATQGDIESLGTLIYLEKLTIKGHAYDSPVTSGLECLVNLPALRSLTLSHLHDLSLKPLADLPSLTSLTLRSVTWVPTIWASLSQLSTLRLYNLYAPRGLMELSHLTNLTDLTISSVFPIHQDTRHLGFMACFPKLRFLNLSYVNTRALSVLSHCPQIESLHLYQLRHVVVLQPVFDLPKLTDLTLNCVGNNRIICQLPASTSLQRLSVSKTVLEIHNSSNNTKHDFNHRKNYHIKII